jgi:type IX secretion system PorP/SprF family membrane protein
MNINPALIGIFNGDIRIGANYRNQWNAANVNYNTFTGGLDMKIPRTLVRNGFLAAGGLLNYDHAGDSKLSHFHLLLGGSYTQQLSEKHFISIGAQIGGGNRSFSMSDLMWADQYNIANPSGSLDPTAETFNNNSKTVFNLNAGVNYHFQIPERRTKMDIGVGFYHLNRPEYGFDQQFEDKFIRTSIHALLDFQIMPKLDLVLNGVYQVEGPHEETVLGVSARHHVSLKKARELSLQLGANYRLEDAIYPHFQINWRTMSLGLSYDINISDFTDASDGRGGPEVYFQYLITRVRPTELKVCPIY